MKFTDEQLSRILTAHADGLLCINGCDWISSINHKGCINQMAFNEPDRYKAFSSRSYEWDVLKATAITIRPVGWRCLNIRLSRSARRFIKRFDAGKPVVPFSFRISMTPWSNKAVRQCIVCNRDGAFLVRVFGPLPGMPKDGEIRKCLVCDDCAMDHFRLSEAWKRSVI